MPSKKSRMVDAILCGLLGEFGAHKFYEGKIGMGILYIFTWGLFGIGMLVDFIIILCGSSKDSDGLIISQWLDDQNSTASQKSAPSFTTANEEVSSAELLKQYKEMLDNGTITQEEFDKKKKQILGL
jgi:TM2 domain-containing membrane protein YozV